MPPPLPHFSPALPQFGRHLDQQRLAQTGQIIERQVSRLIATGVDFFVLPVDVDKLAALLGRA
jgi:hypothetical protein